MLLFPPSTAYSAGVIVESIVKSSTVDLDGRIRIGDFILSVSLAENTSDQVHVVCSEEKYRAVTYVLFAES